MESERNFCLEPLRLVLQQLKSSKNCKKSELELLKFCLNSVINSSKSDKFNCKQYFDILFDVFKYSISILIENKVNEFSFTLYQQLYCDILQISLLELLNCEWKEACYEELHKLLDFSLKCFNVMEKEDTVQEEEKLQIINALSYILDVVKAINGKLSGQILIYVQSYFINLCKSLQIILQHTNNTVTAHLMIYIFKKLYVMDNECSMLKSTWNTISSFFEYKENDYLQEKHTTTYLILCCIMEHFSPEKPMPFFTREKLFWDIVNHGLKHSNSISRKRAMFILKWILNWCDTNCKRGECINLANLFYWYSSDDDLRIAWEDLTVILETLEEKQTHIIKPLLPKIDNLVMITNDKLSSNHLHSSWIMVVFHRMFHHESKYVVKWAITYFLNLNLASFSCLMTQIEKFLPTLLETLNDASLYSRSPSEPIGTCSSIGLAVGEFFKTSFYILGIKDKQVQFFNYLLTCIHQLSWGGVALFYISHALCKIPSTSLWNESSVDKIKELILNSLRTQDLLLRGAIQTFFMKSFYQLIDMEKLSLEDISKLLIVLKRNECFCRGTSLWDATIVWLKELFDKNKRITSDINRFVIDIVDNYISCKDKDETVEISFPGTSNSAAVARIIVLFADAYNISKETKHNKMYDNLIFNKLLKSIVDILASAKSRPYLPVKNINFCLDLISNLLIETKVNNHNSTQFSKNVLRSDIREILIKLLSPHINEILHLISKYILHPFTQFQNIEILRTCIAIFEMIVEERNFISIWPTIQSYVQQCIQRILEEQKSTDTVNFVCWNYLVCVCKSSVFAEMHKNHIKKEILNMIKSYINMNCLRNPFSKPNIPNDRISQAFWRELTSNAECAIWQCIEYYLRNEKDEIIIDYLEKNSMHFLETGSSKAIVFLFKCLHHVLPRMCINEELFTAVVEESWKICLELKKNELFKQAIEAFIYMTYSPITMILPSFKMLDVNKKLLIESGETSSFIILYLIEHCTKIWSDNPSCLTNNLEILCAALTYGPIHRKDQRIVNDAIAYIESFKNDVSVNQLIQPVNNIMVRITAIKFLRRLLLSITEYQRFPIEIVLLLLNQDKQISSTKARHFGNSLIHRTKTRIWQIIILLEPFLTEENCKQLLKEIYSLLVNENHQPSVRYFLEWTVVRIIYHYPTLEKEFTVYFHKAIEKRIGSIVSFISILIHLISVTSEQNLQEFIQTWIREIIPWTMGQNFNTRIYAQLAVQKFMKVCQANKFENILKNYKPVFDGIRMIDNGNVSKNSQKLLTDFYFQVFNPIEHYTMETIFYDLPRLSSLSDEEWIPPHHFDHRLEKFTPNDELKAINCYNANSDLKDFKISEWVLRTSDCLANENQAESDEINNVTNFQKKITPWKQIIPDSETIQEIQTRKQWNNDGLIIVASLIDKTPNLGGLCRTCEVFAVSEYILGSLKYIEDKQFQNLCVTANKWVSIKEVKPHNLKEYLLEMRQEEYTLIGVEQTDNSQSLENFKFPKKSLLLLGNEKEGIPVDLIHLLDVCVEIPQQGIIRSLNVHVSGAILIWEYARQHNLVST